jgi:NTE family protein
MDGSVVMGPSTSPHGTPTRKVEIKSISLALQGGGAHGAFTWGVIDRLLEDERIRFDGISATSAGAMNATALGAGMALGGREGAKKALARLWHRISHTALTSPLQPTLLERLFGNHSMARSGGFLFFELMTRLFSPYEFNPFNRNPLRQVLMDTIDFAALSPTTCPIKLYLAATNVRTGKIKVFDNSEIGVDAVLASACLPFLFQAVEIGGEAYWDGGYSGTRRSSRWSTTARAATSSSCSSARCGETSCRTVRWKSSIASMRSASIPRCCARCGRSDLSLG